jgi:sugar lactone lactonase YvrE
LACGLAAACSSDNGNPGNNGDGGVQPITTGVSTLAGAADSGNIDGSRAIARFNNPVNVLVGPDGLIYVADFDNSEIRAVTTDGTVSTIVKQQGFVRPFGLTFVGKTLYVSTDNDDTGAHSLTSGTVWRVDTSDHTATVVVRDIGRPRGLATLSDGRIVMSDDLHHVVQILNPTTGVITPLAGKMDVAGFADGTGVNARFSTPWGVAVQADGTIVLADFGNQRIRTISLQGVVATMAGTGNASFADGTMQQAEFNNPEGISIAPNGDLFITDTGNFRIRKISGNVVTTFAGNGTGGFLDSTDRLSAEFFGLEGLSVNADGSIVYVADGNRGEALPFNRVRQATTN